MDPTIRLTFPPEARHLRLARLTASSLAADLDYGLRDIEDLKVAIDELCAVLLADAIGPLEVTFAPDGVGLVVEGSASTPAGPAPDLHPIAAELLATMADESAVTQDGDVRRFRLVHRPDDHRP